MRARYPNIFPGMDEYAADILDSLSDAVIAVDRESLLVYANKEFGRLLGRDVSELAGKNIFELVPVANGWMFHRHLAKAISDCAQVRLDNFRFINRRFAVSTT